MRPLRRRRRAARTSRFEPFEPRLVMSGVTCQDADALTLDYFVEDQAFAEVGTALADAHELTGLDEARREFGFSGEGQTVVVIDTGIAYDHLALGGGYGTGYRVVGGFDFTEEYDADPYDDGPLGSHGTHVAGIIASSDGTNPGVAPGVDLVALRVFNDDGQGYFEWIEDALQWVHQNLNAFANPITTVNLSVGTDYNAEVPPSWATIEDELAQLEADGLFISVAAGNGFTSYNEPGLSYPATSPYVVPVASVDDNGQLSYYSQRSDRVIAAPGRSVTSTVPDYVGNGNGNGIDDDFASYSGTSMAAPYVAGASVLLRQAFEFVGVTDVTQDMLYDVMRSTSDLVYDPATGQNYCRLNLQRALESIMPADDFGSYAYAAEDLGTLGSQASASASRSVSGTIGTLDDRDFFTFTAAETGRVTFSIDVTHNLSPEWEVAGSQIVVDAQNGTMSFDASAGQTYAVGLGTEAGLGHYTIDVRLEADYVPPSGTAGRQQERLDQSVSAAGQWFAFTAAQDGILTVEARFSNAAGDVDLELFDANQRRIGGSYTTGDVERIDVNVSAGDTTYVYAYLSGAGVNENVDLRMTNMVARVGQTVQVTGTNGDDAFVFTAGSTHQITINGVSYSFDSGAVSSVTFDGLGGSDTATLRGTAADEEAVLAPGTGELVSGRGDGPGYSARVTNVEDVTAEGRGGADVAYLFDSPGDDTFYAGDEEARLTGPGFTSQVVGFPYVHAYATAGGYDVAYLYDSPGDDVFLATPIYGKIYGDGFARRAKLFEAVHAYAVFGGHDAAYLFGSAGDDTFVSRASFGKMYGAGYFNRAKSFEEVYAAAGQGGHDRAQVFDSRQDDQLVASGSSARLFNASQATWLFGFQNLDVSATSGGADHAEIAAVDYLLRLLGDWQ